ncbi:hypothetical protein D3C73_1279690 [compost metagenome]
MVVDVHWPGVERLLPGERQQPVRQRGRAARRAEGCAGIEFDLFWTRVGHALLDQLQARNDAGQQVVEVVGDAASQLAQRVHLLHLQ